MDLTPLWGFPKVKIKLAASPGTAVCSKSF